MTINDLKNIYSHANLKQISSVVLDLYIFMIFFCSWRLY